MKPPKGTHFPRRTSLSTKLTAVVTLIVLLATVVTVRCSLNFFVSQFKEGAATDQLELVRTLAGELDDNIVVAQAALRAVAETIPPAMARDSHQVQRFLDTRRDLRIFFSGGSVYLSPEGVVVAASSVGGRTLIGEDLSYRPYFQHPVKTRQPYISEPYVSLNDGRPSVMFTVPVLDGEGHLAGILCGRLDLAGDNILGKVVREKPPKGRHFYLFNKEGQIISHPDMQRVSAQGGTQNKGLLERMAAGGSGSVESVGDGGELVLSSFTKLGSTGWILAAETPLAEVYAPSQQTQRKVLGTLALVLLSSLPLLWLMVRRLTAPLLHFAGKVERMTDGEGPYLPICSAGEGEIGVVAAAFNRMIQEVGAQQRALEEEKRFSEKLLLNTAVPSFVIDANLTVIIWNRACEELTGTAAAEMVGRREAWRGFYPEKRAVLAELVVRGNLWEMENLYERYSDSPLIPDGLRAEGWYLVRGRERYLSFDAAPIRDSVGGVIAAIQTIQDLTQRMRKEDELRRMVAATAESEERFRRLVELSLDGIALLVERRFVFINAAGCDILGVPSPDLLAGEPVLHFVERGSLELLEEQLKYVEGNRESSPWLEQRLVRGDRSTVDVELGVSPFVYEGKEALQVIFRDITERKLAKARLETLAHYDSLTSLPNRVLFFDRLYHAAEESKRHGYPFALLFLDLDGFKWVNDTLGHQAGDAVLVQVGQRLKECVRACDMVARMGGDEFTVILGKLAGEEDAALVAERILDALTSPFEICGETRTIGASIGICVFPSAAKDVAEIVSHADSAMYQVKQTGKNGYSFYGGALACYAGA